VRPDELERQLRERLDALGPAPRAELLHVLMLPTSTATTCSPINHGTKRGETRGDAAPEEQGQQAMRAILLIPAAVAVIIVVVCLVVYFLYGRGDEEDDDGLEILRVLSDLLSSWW
jgi:hypothetical protein